MAGKRVETSEWEEAQYKAGNKVGKYADPQLEAKILEQKLADNLNLGDAEIQPFEHEKQGVTAEEGDENAELRELAELRRKRLDELHAQAKKITYGTLNHITKVDYIEEVTRAPKDVWVVLLLMKREHSLCEKLSGTFQTLAKHFTEVKFLSIISTECIPNFPDKHLPSTLIYRNGKLERSVHGINEWGGTKFEEEDVVYMLTKWGIIPGTEQ